jgi:predicted metal-binding membrane protein
MRGMDNGPWTDLGTFGWFLSVWIVMMAAMMFPSVAPTVALYARMSRGSRLTPVVFVTGYLITWAGAGVIAFLIGAVASQVAPDLAWEHAGRFLTGATLLLAALTSSHR